MSQLASIARRLVRRGLQTAAVAGGVGGAGFCGYVYVTTPQPVPSSAYQQAQLETPPLSREAAKQKLQNTEEPFDLVVIGGGATGVSVALDGASRGLKVALLEKEDFASGTSSRSTKLLHGGVRYLRDAVFKLDGKALHMVYEALRERSHMLNCNPYMNHPVPMLIPCYSYWSLFQNLVGIKLYELIAAFSTLFRTHVPNSYLVSTSNCHFLFPLLRDAAPGGEGLKGGVILYDGQQNDARMNVQLALTAATETLLPDWEAATVLNYARVTGFDFDPDTGKIVGVRVEDEASEVGSGSAGSGSSFAVKAKCVVNCAGPFADAVRVAANPEQTPMVTTSSGTHLVLPSSYASQQVGLLIPETSDGRVLFVLPWEGEVCAGTTDVPCELTNLPKPLPSENEFIVSETAKYLTVDKTEIAADVKAAWNGLRPLVRLPSAEGASKTSELSRDFEILVDAKSGLISVLGGKWTTCRLMGERAVDVAIKTNNLRPKHPSRTWGIRVAAALDPEAWNPKAKNPENADLVNATLKLARGSGLSLKDADYLLRSYGPRHARRIVGRASEIERLRFDEKKTIPVNISSVFLAEVEHAFDYELALSVTDAIARRSRLAFLDPISAKFALPWVVEWTGDRKNWSLPRRLKELDDALAFLETTSY